jgi:glycosyltransferase involved in cell wall biosynthesis
MKLVIQVPCLNEEATLPQTIRDLPRSIEGVDKIEVLIIDDGSADRTVLVAQECGAHSIISLGTRRGLATAFMAGLDKAMEMGADIVVNTDGDNQYVGADIAKLVQPILAGKADIVVGCRPILDHPEFSPVKKVLQLVGSATLRMLSQTQVRDAASGFRAFSREACMRLYVHTRFSYCMETLIQAGNSKLRVGSTDIRVNRHTRPSRLFKSVPEYIWRSGTTMVMMFVHYRPGMFFALISAKCFLLAGVLGARFLYMKYLVEHRDIHQTFLPSLILLSILALMGGLTAALGIIAELMKAERRLTEEVLCMLRKQAHPNFVSRVARGHK